ncbi:MAG TPA: 23S rRNA (uracil(1939)-C(5))-methyltransferase RlmD [Candidatus Saccharimonadales bacterium]|nr:23S rRNA (uracil(1939)-C(5))-methyltransferase RlmD [Candidatus Saccharimonadales bacterium]
MTTPLRKGEIVSLTIEDLAFGGPGVARHEGFVVMVRHGLPGDTVRAEVDRVRKTFAEASTVEVVEPSERRVEPACAHFGVCGGCKWQDLEYAAQLEYKRRQVVEALRRIGHLEDPPVEPTLPSPETFFYRNKMEFSFGRDPEGLLLLGLHPAGSYREVFDLRKCHLESEMSNRVVACIRDECRAKELPPYDVRTHEGFLRYVAIREGKLTGEMMVNLVTAEGRDAEVAEIAQAVTAQFPAIVSFVRSINSRRATVAIGEREEVLYGHPYITERIAGATFEITASSFFQTNSRQAERLYSAVLEAAELTPEDSLLDLYSGTGTISILAARTAKEVRGVESQPDAIRNAERNAALNGVRNCFFVRADVKKALIAMKDPRQAPTVIVVNPPRAGLSKSIVRHALRLAPRRLVYVSCNPTTLARDLRLICERDYTLRWIRPVDMFPHTAHIECVVRVDRTEGSGRVPSAGAGEGHEDEDNEERE